MRDEQIAAPAPLAITLLGGFQLTRGSDVVELPPGRPRMLVALVAASGGKVDVEDAVAALWPEADPSTGRRRLRNVLNRIGGGVLERAENDLRLAGGTVIDAEVFARAARDALGNPRELAVPAARRALELYRGELLPSERADWVAAPRERLRRAYVELLDGLAVAAEAREDYDEAQRLLARAIEADRFDDRRYLLVAQLLAAQGRRGAALAALRQGAEALAELGLEPSPTYARLAERLGTQVPEAAGASTPSLPVRDYEATLEVVGEIHDAQDVPELHARLLSTLRRLVPADTVAINEMLGGGRPGAYAIDPPIAEELLPAWQRLGHTNPLLQRYLRTRDGRPYRFSDVLSREELEAMPLYREFYVPMGIRYQIAFTLPAPADVTVAVVLSRRDPDFTDQERDRLELVRPHIIQAYRNVQLRTGATAPLEAPGPR